MKTLLQLSERSLYFTEIVSEYKNIPIGSAETSFYDVVISLSM